MRTVSDPGPPIRMGGSGWATVSVSRTAGLPGIDSSLFPSSAVQLDRVALDGDGCGRPDVDGSVALDVGLRRRNLDRRRACRGDVLALDLDRAVLLHVQTGSSDGDGRLVPDGHDEGVSDRDDLARADRHGARRPDGQNVGRADRLHPRRSDRDDLVGSHHLRAADADRDRLVVDDRFRAVVCNGRLLVVADSLGTVVADRVGLVRLYRDFLIPLGVDRQELRAPLVLEADLVVVRRTAAERAAALDAALRLVSGQVVWWHALRVVDAADDDRLIHVSFEKIDHDLLADAGNVNRAPGMAGPRRRDPNPAGAVAVVLAFTVPVELHLDARVLVRENLLARGPYNDGGLCSPDRGNRSDAGRAEGQRDREAGEVVLIGEAAFAGAHVGSLGGGV